jgi:hypothetical protein
MVAAIILCMAFGAFSLAFWGYFRFRKGAPEGLETEGEFDIR